MDAIFSKPLYQSMLSCKHVLPMGVGFFVGVVSGLIVAKLSKVSEVSKVSKSSREKKETKLSSDHSVAKEETKTSMIIGDGAYGTVYKPPLMVCDDTINILYRSCDKYVMKTSNLKEDMKLHAKLRNIDPDQKYFIRLLDVVSLEKDVSSGYKYGYYMLYGGTTLYAVMMYTAERYCDKIKYVNFVKICNSLINGLKLLHDNGLVHGDIHSKNIVIDLHGNARLIDFSQSTMSFSFEYDVNVDEFSLLTSLIQLSYCTEECDALLVDRQSLQDHDDLLSV